MKVGEKIYREKLIPQIEAVENAQKVCAITDIPEFVEFSENILKLAQRVDEFDSNVAVKIDGKEVYKAVLKAK